MDIQRLCGNCRKPLAVSKRKYCCNACRLEAESLKTITGRRKRAKKKASALAEINAAARSEGLSYGQYVAKYGNRKDEAHGKD